MKKLITLLTIVGLFAGLSFAAEDGEKKVEKVIKKEAAAPMQKDQQGRRPGMPPGMSKRQRGSADPQQRYQQMLLKRAEVHQKAIGELEAIRKIAEEENATRTVAAIQEMIAKKNAAYKKEFESLEKKRRERSEQIRKRTGEPKLKQPGEKKAKESPAKKESDK